MHILKCLIIEDEPLAADILKDYILDTPHLELTGICRSAMDAIEVLRKSKVDVLLIDIQLPKLNGIDFARTILNKYHVIFTTAYHEYAVEGFNVNAVDYLLKPIEFSRFLTAIQKIYERPALHQMPNHRTFSYQDPNLRHLFFNTDKRQVKVELKDIHYIESLRDFIYIHMEANKIMVRYKISALEKKLSQHHFLRVHKSYIVNLEKIVAYSAGYVELSKGNISIGRSYKNQVHEILERYQRS